MDQLLSLRIFCRVAAQGSFSKAARDFGMTQSAASRGVLALEERLGVRLLERSTRRVALTPEGRAFREQVASHLQALEDAERLVRSGFGEVAGRVRMAAPAALGRRLVLPEVLQLLDGAPGLEIEISLTDRRVDLIRGEYDFSLRVGRASELSWVERHVGHSEQWLVGTGRLLLASGLPSKIGDLEGYPAIVTGSRQRFDEIGFDVRLVTDDLEGGLHAALAGAGIAALPRWLVRPYVESGRLVRVLPEEVIMKAPVVLLHPRRLRRVARDVMDHLARHLSKALLE